MSAIPEREIHRYMVVLEDILARCKNVLNQRNVHETDLREALCLIKMVHADAKKD